MATISDILSKEKERSTEEQMRQIHLFPDGTFYRAYEWSAWLCVRYIKQFKVTHREIKSVDSDMLFIGFPQKSFEKFIINDAIVDEHEDKSLTMRLPASLFENEMGRFI